MFVKMGCVFVRTVVVIVVVVCIVEAAADTGVVVAGYSTGT